MKRVTKVKSTRMVLDYACPIAESLIDVPVTFLESAFAMSRQYVAQGAEGKDGSRIRAERHIADSAEPIAPTVAFCMPGPNKIEARFIDGRHRFCVLRDLGARRIRIGTTKRWADWLCENGKAKVAA